MDRKNTFEVVTSNTITGTTTNSNIFVSTGTTISVTSGTNIVFNTWPTPKSKYIIFEKEIEVEGYVDNGLASCISLINTLGIKFYIELKKQHVNLPKEIEDFLEKEIVSYYRNKTIDEIMK